MYFRITILIDEAFHTIKSNDSVTEWSSKDSNDPMFLEGSSPVEARLLRVTCPVTFFKEFEIEHSNIYLIDLDIDTLYISDDDIYRWLWTTDRSVDEHNGEASHILQGSPLDDINMICQVEW